MEVNAIASKGVDDSHCNRNKEEYGKPANVGQNESICYHQVVYVAWPRISLREITYDNIEQSYVNICS